MRFKNWLWPLALVIAALALLFVPVLAFAQPPAPPPQPAPQGPPATLPDGHPNIIIADAYRIQNKKGAEGICWWACAEMIARQYQIKPLIGLCDKVVATGIGWLGGARDEDIVHWHKTLGQVVVSNPHGKSQEGIAWIRTKLDEGKPVIVGVLLNAHDPRTKHAVLVTYLSYQAKDWEDGKGYKTKDFIVRYIDPNDSTKIFEQPWTPFWERAQGPAWAYDVVMAPVIAPMPDRPPEGPNLQPQPMPIPGGKVVDPKVMQRVDAQLAQPAQLIKPTHVAVLGFSIEIKGGHPLITGIVPSNQDIKDGIKRPSDVLENNAFGQYYFGGYDYYAEFKEKVRTGQVQVKIPDPPKPADKR